MTDVTANHLFPGLVSDNLEQERSERHPEIADVLRNHVFAEL